MLSPELTLLIQGRALLSDPKKWTTGSMARTDHDFPVPWNDPKATCWCSLGILSKLSTGETRVKANQLLDAEVKPGDWFEHGEVADIAMFNDRHTHEEVMALWDRAIAAQYAREVPSVESF